MNGGCSTGDKMGLTGNTTPVTAQPYTVPTPYLAVQVMATGFVWCSNIG